MWSSRLVFVLGLVTITAALVPRRRELLAWPLELLPPMGLATVTVLGLGVGVGLVIMARGLRRRKRLAWRAVVALLGTTVVVHGLESFRHPAQTGLALAVVGALVLTRHQFTGRADPRTRRRVPLVLLALTMVSWVLGCMSTVLDPDGLAPGWTLPQVMVQSLVGLFGVTGPLRYRGNADAMSAAVRLLGLGILVLLLTLAALLSNATLPPRNSPEQRARIRALLGAAGDRDSLGYFALRDDKAYVFSASGKAAVAYRVQSGVCLAAGDPVGDVEAWPGAISAWLDLARDQAWIPAVLSASETAAEVYGRAGLDAVEIGDEAILDVDAFTLAGGPMKSVRQAVGRARRAGVMVAVATVGELGQSHLADLRRTSAPWRKAAGAERGFSMALSRFGGLEDPDNLVVESYSADGALVGLLQLVPWGSRGWSLDLMRRAPDLPAGTMELMIVELVAAVRERGGHRVSMNFAMFRSALARAERVGAGPVVRLWVRLLLLTSRWFQIASLYRANAKLCPDWEPRFLCFETVRDLGTVTIAGLRSEGLLTAPSLDPRGRWASRAAAIKLGSTSTGGPRAGLVAADRLDPVPADPVPADPVPADPVPAEPVPVEPTREVALNVSH